MSKIGRSWRVFRGLSWGERQVLAKALVWLPLIAIALRSLGFRRVRAVLLPKRTERPPGTDLVRARVLARIVHGAAQWSPVSASCLPRALILCRILEQAGLQAELKVGVAKPEGSFTAHAWVEHDGVALAEAEPPERRFTTFDQASLARGA